MKMDRYYVKQFDEQTVSVLEVMGCKDLDNRIVCDCVIHGDLDQASADAFKIANALNLLEESKP